MCLFSLYHRNNAYIFSIQCTESNPLHCAVCREKPGYYWLRACCCSEGVTSEKVDRSDSHCRCCSVHMTSQCLPTVRLLYAPLPQWKFECLPDSLNKTWLYLLDFIIQRGLTGVLPNKIVHSSEIWISLTWSFLLILFQSINIHYTTCKDSAVLCQSDSHEVYLIRNVNSFPYFFFLNRRMPIISCPEILNYGPLSQSRAFSEGWTQPLD